MILSNTEILENIKLGNIQITPYNADQLNPNSYDLKLYPQLVKYTDDILDPKKNLNTETIEIPESGYTINPGEFYLARTYEHTQTSNLVPMLEGRSSIARLSMSIHQSAGFGDVGFSGYWTLEISTQIPVILYPYMRICQIFYIQLAGESSLYKGKYQNNSGIQESLIHRDFT